MKAKDKSTVFFEDLVRRGVAREVDPKLCTPTAVRCWEFVHPKKETR